MGMYIILVPKVLLTRHLIRRLVLNHYFFVQTFQPVIVIYRRVNLFIIIWGVHKFMAHCTKMILWQVSNIKVAFILISEQSSTTG